MTDRPALEFPTEEEAKEYVLSELLRFSREEDEAEVAARIVRSLWECQRRLP